MTSLHTGAQGRSAEEYQLLPLKERCGVHVPCPCFWVQRVAELFLGAPLVNSERFAHRLLTCACACVSIMQEDIGSSTQRC
jgi:hypothetical protein